MIIECIIITALFVIMAGVFFFKKRKLWAMATLPLTLVPLSEVLFAFLLPSVFNISVGYFVRMIAMVIAVAISCVWIGCVPVGSKNKKLHITYIGITNIFNITLAIIFIHNILIAMGYWD